MSKGFKDFIEENNFDDHRLFTKFGKKFFTHYDGGIHSVFTPMESGLSTFSKFISPDIDSKFESIPAFSKFQTVLSFSGVIALSTGLIYMASIVFILLNVISTIDNLYYYRKNFRKQLMSIMMKINNYMDMYARVIRTAAVSGITLLYTTDFENALNGCIEFFFEYLPKQDFINILNELNNNSILKLLYEETTVTVVRCGSWYLVPRFRQTPPGSFHSHITYI